MNIEHTNQPDCPFCYVNKLFKGTILAETPDAYLAQNYTSPNNYLMIPKGHFEIPIMLPDTWWSDIKKLLATLPKSLEHYNISLNVGEHAGQTVKHLHFWVIPRIPGQPSSGRGLATLLKEIDQAAG